MKPITEDKFGWPTEGLAESSVDEASKSYYLNKLTIEFVTEGKPVPAVSKKDVSLLQNPGGLPNYLSGDAVDTAIHIGMELGSKQISKQQADKLMVMENVEIVVEEKSVSQMSDEELLELLIASKSLEKLHKGKGGLEQHLAHSQKKTEEYKNEILKRMKSGK